MKEQSLKRLNRDKYMLYTINKAKPSLRKAILKHSPASLIKTISEICYNILKGNCNLSKKSLDGLKKHKKQLRFVSSASNSSNLKRKRLIQSGGSVFLPLLLAPLIIDLFAGVD